MLERFKPREEDQVRITEPSLRQSVAAIFEKMGVSPEDAAEGANTLVMADLRGVETHGVSNMLRSYVQQYNNGSLNPRPNWRILRESPATATIDADKGLAVILGPKAMRMAIDKARVVGMGVVSMHNAGHSGGIGHHAMLAAEQDMVGMCMTAGGVMVLPTFAAEPRLGTNPIAIAAPAATEPPLLFDAATSAIAGNKQGLAMRVGADLLPGWISDADGVPIMEETPVRPRGEYYHLPLGGTREQGSHKGIRIRPHARSARHDAVRRRAHHGGPGDHRLQALLRGLQHCSLHRRRPVQARHGPDAQDAARDTARAGP